VLKIRDEVATGQRLQRAMKSTALFPNMVNQMIAVGEESGSLDDMSSKVADFYEEEVDSMSSLLEPLIMSILGVLVGGLVIAMYLPIFKMGQVV
jgi:type IV pilus assembly protein PilC